MLSGLAQEHASEDQRQHDQDRFAHHQPHRPRQPTPPRQRLRTRPNSRPVPRHPVPPSRPLPPSYPTTNSLTPFPFYNSRRWYISPCIKPFRHRKSVYWEALVATPAGRTLESSRSRGCFSFLRARRPLHGAYLCRRFGHVRDEGGHQGRHGP